MLAQSFAPIVGGEERVVEDLSRELVARGHDVLIATLQQPGDVTPGEVDGARVHALAQLRLPGHPRPSGHRAAPRTPRSRPRDRARSQAGARARAAARSSTPTTGSSTPTCRWPARSPRPWCSHSTTTAWSARPSGCARPRHVCTGPAPVKCQVCASDHYGPAKGLVAAVGTRWLGPRLRRHVDVFLPVSSTVARTLPDREDEAARVIPNFIGELPEPRPRRSPPSRAPRRALHPLLRRRHRGQGCWHLADAYATSTTRRRWS